MGSKAKEEKITAKVENIVSGITLNQKIDLKKFAAVAKGLEYNPEKFPGVVYRVKKPKLAMLIFSSGKVICTGARSKGDILVARDKLIKKLAEGGTIVETKPVFEPKFMFNIDSKYGGELGGGVIPGDLSDKLAANDNELSDNAVVEQTAEGEWKITDKKKYYYLEVKDGKISVSKEGGILIQNIVASSSLGFEVNLDMLAMEAENTEYEPEQFPGLVFSLKEPKTVMLVFKSGKMIITGAKTSDAANEAARRTKKAIEAAGVKIEKVE
ncbi:MAG: TATA-box-binding protein [Candidatus Altiarchaeales archaeon]|nr:TATA-box-binding protein [Candidatus Altiarchaeales archaeon]